MRLAWLAAGLLVAPVFVPVAWTGLHVGLRTDPVLGVISPLEQPLSIRTVAGLWTTLLVVGWFGLALRSRQLAVWEYGCVVLGGLLALVRLGNIWLAALLLLAALARQLSTREVPRVVLAGVATLSAVVGIANWTSLKPPPLPGAVDRAVQSTNGTVFADWRWAAGLQRELGPQRVVLGAAGLVDTPSSYWLDYVRIERGHERWDSLLDQYAARVVILEPADAPEAAQLIRTSIGWRVLVDTADVVVAERS
jgi:hypothetical protein